MSVKVKELPREFFCGLLGKMFLAFKSMPVLSQPQCSSKSPYCLNQFELRFLLLIVKKYGLMISFVHLVQLPNFTFSDEVDVGSIQ